MKAVRTGAASATITFLFQLLILPFVLTTLGSSLYGTWIAMTALLAIGSLADAGIRTEVARRVAYASGANDEVGIARAAHQGTAIMTLVVLPVTAVMIAFSGQIASTIFPNGVPGYSDAEVHGLIGGMLVIMAINLIIGAHFATVRGIQRSDIEQKALIAALPINASILCVTVASGWGLASFLAAYAASVGTSLLVQYAGLRRILPSLKFRCELLPPRAIVGYLSLSGLALISQVGDIVDSQWDKVILSRFVGPEAVTFFHLGASLVMQVKVLALVPLSPLMVAIAEVRGREQTVLIELQTRLMKTGSAILAALMGGMFLYAPAFFVLWLGTNYESAGQVAKYFTIAAVLNLIAAPLAFQAFAEGLHRLAAIAAGANIVVNMALSLILTMQMGLMGAVFGSIGGNLVGTALFLLLARRHLSYWVAPPWRAILLVATAAAFIEVLEINHPASWLAFAIHVATFGLLAVSCSTVVEKVSPRFLVSLIRQGR